jgi:hypothetical protein
MTTQTIQIASGIPVPKTDVPVPNARAADDRGGGA